MPPFAKSSLLNPSQVDALAQLLSPDSEVQEAFLSGALGPGRPVGASRCSRGTPAASCDHLAHDLVCHWSQVCLRDPHWLYARRTAGRSHFSVRLGTVLQRARQKIRKLNLSCWWWTSRSSTMKDPLRPVCSTTADRLVERAQDLVHTVAWSWLA